MFINISQYAYNRKLVSGFDILSVVSHILILITIGKALVTFADNNIFQYYHIYLLALPVYLDLQIVDLEVIRLNGLMLIIIGIWQTQHLS